MSLVTNERRAVPRFREATAHGIASLRVRPGHHADLVDVSERGALLETMYRLLPGTSVELHMETKSGKTSIRGRVVRCMVSKLFPESVWYRGAVQFDRHLPCCIGEHGYGLPGAERPARHDGRVDATQDVI
jgi:hypothetical protein